MGDWQGEVLVVDDDAGNLLALEALLEPLGQAKCSSAYRCAAGQGALCRLRRE